MNKDETIELFYSKNKDFNLELESYNCKILNRLISCGENDEIFYESEDYFCIPLRKLLEQLIILSLIKHIKTPGTEDFLNNFKKINILAVKTDEDEKEIFNNSKKWDKHLRKINDEIISNLFNQKTIISNKCGLHDGHNDFVMPYQIWYETIELINDTINDLRTKRLEGNILSYKKLIFFNKITNDNKLKIEILKERNNSETYLEQATKKEIVDNKHKIIENSKKETKILENEYTKKTLTKFIKKFYWGKDTPDRFFQIDNNKKNIANQGNKILIKNTVEDSDEEKIHNINELKLLLNGIFTNNELIVELDNIINNSNWFEILNLVSSKFNIDNTVIFKAQDLTLDFFNHLYLFIIKLSEKRNNVKESFFIFDETINGYTFNLEKEIDKRIEIIKNIFINPYTRKDITEKTLNDKDDLLKIIKLNDFSYLNKNNEENFLLEFKAIFIEYWYFYEHEESLNKFISKCNNFWNRDLFKFSEEELFILKKIIYYKEIFNGHIIKKWEINLPQNNFKSWTSGIENYINVPFLKFELEILKYRYKFLNLFIKNIQNDIGLIKEKDYKIILLNEFLRIKKNALDNIFFVLPEISEINDKKELLNKITHLFVEENVLKGWSKWENPIALHNANFGGPYFDFKTIEKIKEKITSDTAIENIIDQVNLYKKDLNNEYSSYRIDEINKCITNKNLKFQIFGGIKNFGEFWDKYIETIKNDYKEMKKGIDSNEWKEVINEIIKINNELKNIK